MKALALLLPLLLAACKNVSHVQYEVVPKEGDFVEGTTHYREVLERYGAPVALADIPHGFLMAYERIVVAEGALGVQLAEAGYFGGSTGGRDYQAAVLLFDDDGVLHNMMVSGQGLQTGGGLQVATSGTQGFVGGKDYGDAASPLGWGMRMLKPLPALLNEPWSRIEVGEKGFELVDTPRDAGQHTLGKPRRKKPNKNLIVF